MDFDRARKIMDEGLALLEKKNQDYSSDNILWSGIPGIAVRLMDKVLRLRNLADKPDQINYESLEDTLIDIINYGIIGRLIQEDAIQPTYRLVYLAGPIDDIGREEAIAWRASLGHWLSKHGISSFDPVGAYRVANIPSIAQQVVTIDKFAISQCDALVAYLGGKGRAFGTIREIEHAREMGKRVIVVADRLESAFSHDVEVVPTLGGVIRALTGEDEEVL